MTKITHPDQLQVGRLYIKYYSGEPGEIFVLKSLPRYYRFQNITGQGGAWYVDTSVGQSFLPDMGVIPYDTGKINCCNELFEFEERRSGADRRRT